MPGTAGDAWPHQRAGTRWHRAVLAAVRSVLAALLVALVAPSASFADSVKGQATLTKPGDYARLVIKLQTTVDADVRLAGTILIIHFKQPIDVAVEKLAEAAPDYVGSARIDPDGAAIRLALSRKVTPNVMAAGERLFIDLLPDSWTGLPPGLPIEVVKELAERARAAEQQLRLERIAAEAQKKPPVRVKASRQPTFVRYVFELPEGTGVSTILNSDQLILNFNSELTFDLADARIVDATNVSAINQKTNADTTVVSFDLIGNVDVHSFREEKTYIVDIGFEPADKSKATQADEAAKVAAKLGGAPPAVKSAAPADPARAPVVSNAQPAEPPKPTPPAPPQASVERVADAAPAMREGPTPAAVSAPVDVKPPTAAPAAAAVDEKPAAPDQNAATIQAKRSAGNLHLFVPFAAPTAAAVFSRDDAIWLVFDADAPLNITQISKESAGLVLDVTQVAASGGRAIRLRLSRPQLASMSTDGNTWIVDISDASQLSPEALATVRNIADRTRATISIPFAGASRLLKFADPDTGDAVIAVTAPPPIRGFVRQQSFVDFSLLQSAHGVIVRPNSDDLKVELAADKITLGRPGGLTLSAAEASEGRSTAVVKPIFDLATWKIDREQDFVKRLDALTAAAAMSTGDRRIATHTDLARFYVARGFYLEARGVLDTLFAEARPGADDIVALVLHAVINILSGNTDDGLAELNNPLIGAGYDSQLWKAVAYARQHNWGTAREQFKGVEFAIGGLPVDLQRVVIVDEIRAALETRDYSGVASRLSDLDLIGVPQDMQPSLAVLRGRMDEALGKDRDATSNYQLAMASNDSQSAAEAEVDEIALRQRRNEIAPEEALVTLETLSMMWRGDITEVRTLQLLSRLYANVGRYRDAFVASRSATKIQPNSEPSRQMQDATSALFSEIFLGPKGDDLPPVDALALFYEFSELTPIGRRGDELIRKLADRLVNVDLLDQASELLQYQIDQRLDGAARAQVASRLAMIYLMNRKPDRAIAVLRATRIGDLASELRMQRLLIEARAQSDIGRHDLALDIISNISGREAVRLRSDIYWAARRWRESSEQIELLYGDRWRDFQPLTDEEKADIIRAGIGYALAADTIGIARLREKYAAKMESGPDKSAFDAATKPAYANSSQFSAIARMAASVDTLDGFVRDMKVRFPEVASREPLPDEVKADPSTTASLPTIKGLRPAPNGAL